MFGYCVLCGSKLYPLDDDYIKVFGICSYCVTVARKAKARCKHCDELAIGALVRGPGGKGIAKYKCETHGWFSFP